MYCGRRWSVGVCHGSELEDGLRREGVRRRHAKECFAEVVLPYNSLYQLAQIEHFSCFR